MPYLPSEICEAQMPIYFRPPEMPSAGGGDIAAGNRLEIPGAGLSAGVESQLATPGDVSQAHSFFQPNMKGALSIASITPGAEAAALGPMPGADAAAMGAITPGAEQVSPLIQLIMKLPGIGAVTSFFDALAALFMPGAHSFASFDLTQIGAHAQGAVASLSSGLGEHLPISLSLLPADAPILQGLGLGAGHHMNGLTYLPGKLGSSLSEHGLGTMSRDALNVSGQLDINKPQFEFGSGLEKGAAKFSGIPGAKGPLTSGAYMSEAPVGSHLAGTQRLFSDQTSLSSASSPLAPSNTSSTVGLSQSVPLSGSQWPSSMQVGASNFGTDVNVGAHAEVASGSISDGMISGPDASQNVGHHIGSPARAALDGGHQLGPSGAVSDQLGGRSLLANDGIPTYKPTFGDSASGTFNSQSLVPASKSAPSAGSADAGSAIKGLKAKQLSLKTPASMAKPVVAQHHPVMDHVAHQTKAGAHSVAKTSNVADQTAHQAINKVGTHKPHIPAEHKVAHASEIKHASPKVQVDSPVKQSNPLDQTIAQADVPQVQGTDGMAPVTDAPAGTYTIQSGDNLWNIAKEHLGSGLRWTEIYKMNADVLGSNPSLIHTGTTIRLPGAGTEIATAGAEAGKYVVQPGDNLWDIASDHLGGGQHWGELYKANANVIGSNPSLILPGQELSLSGQPGMQLASHGPTVHPMHPTVQPTVAQHAPVQPTAPAPMQAAQTGAVAEVPQPQAVPETTMPTATYEQMPAPAAHPVVPATHAESTGLPPAEAAPTPIVRPTPTIKAAGASIVSPSLRPDLSFLSKKAR